MDFNEDKDYSDDEVFFGRLSLKEVKKRILMDLHQKNMTKQHGTRDIEPDVYRIIETSSEPDLIGNKDVSYKSSDLISMSDPTFNRDCHKQEMPMVEYKQEDSFLEIEKMVTELCMSPEKSRNNNLDNTLDVVDFVLHHAQSQQKDLKNDLKETEPREQENNDSYFDNDVKLTKDEILSQSASHQQLDKESFHTKQDIKLLLNPSEAIPQEEPQILQHINGCCKNIKHETASVINTPTSNKKPTTNIFKTPKIPTSVKKDSNFLGRTPNRTKAYQHIASPVATYIKKSPQVPLVKDVHPKKPLPSTSSIPKLMKSGSENKISNKENVILPSLAYRSAKKTKVINVNKEKLPQSNWAQKLTALPKPVVLKHDHRETVKRPLLSQQEDSFANLSLHQAEVSVCTQKLAYNKT